MIKKNIKEFLPLGFLNIISFISIIHVITSNYIFEIKQYIGLSLLLICTILFFVNRKFYKYFIFITIIIGVINLIAFSSTTFTFVVGLIEIQLIPFIAFIIYVSVFKSKIISILSNPKSKKENENDFKISKNRFKQKFKNLSKSEIETRLNEKLVPEAIEALKELKNEFKI